MLSAKEFAVFVTAFSCLGGCATESDVFRRMSAEDHEQAATSARSAPDSSSVANEHLLVARQLREAEQFACADVGPEDRDLGPFARKERIVAIEPLSARPWAKGMPQPSGIAVYVRATPGLTEQWLDRVIECHLAHHAVVGNRIPDRDSPLFVDDTTNSGHIGPVRVALSTYGEGFRIAITARDIDAAREVIERGRSLVE